MTQTQEDFTPDRFIRVPQNDKRLLTLLGAYNILAMAGKEKFMGGKDLWRIRFSPPDGQFVVVKHSLLSALVATAKALYGRNFPGLVRSAMNLIETQAQEMHKKTPREVEAMGYENIMQVLRQTIKVDLIYMEKMRERNRNAEQLKLSEATTTPQETRRVSELDDDDTMALMKHWT